MGLLVAGITGGASLIKTAQLRSVITESETYRTAVYTYYSQFGVMPGLHSNGDMIPAYFWNDLKNNNIVDKNVSSPEICNCGVASKFRKAYWYVENVTTNSPDTDIAKASSGILEEFINLNILYISGTVELVRERPFVPNDAKSVDEKIDDGVYNTGYVRGIQTAARSGTYSYGNSSNLTNYSLVIKLNF
jgi:hypothetical protein